MATIQQIETINVAVADGGLAQVFAEKNVDPLIVGVFTTEGIQTLEDFASSFTAANWEKEAEDFRDKVESLKGKTVFAARLRNAVILARAVINRPPPEKEAAPLADFEAPLDAGQKDQMAKAWTTRYGIVLTMHLCPADPLVNRLFREFRSNTPSLILVNKMRSLYTDHNPDPVKMVPIGDGLSLTVQGKEQNEVVRDVAQYYFRLRILANASAKAGNYEWDSKVEKDSKVTFAPLDVNLDYADFAFRSTIQQPGTAWALRQWLEERDLHTRGLMCNYMKGGMAQGEALQKALSDCQIKWGTPPAAPAAESRRRLRGDSPPRYNGDGKGHKKRKLQVMGKFQQTQSQHAQSSKGGKDGGGKGVKYATIAKGGKKICRSYNSGQCKEPCPYNGAHVCAVVGCGLKHPSSRHNQTR